MTESGAMCWGRSDWVEKQGVFSAFFQKSGNFGAYMHVMKYLGYVWSYIKKLSYNIFDSLKT